MFIYFSSPLGRGRPAQHHVNFIFSPNTTFSIVWILLKGCCNNRTWYRHSQVRTNYPLRDFWLDTLTHLWEKIWGLETDTHAFITNKYRKQKWNMCCSLHRDTFEAISWWTSWLFTNRLRVEVNYLNAWCSSTVTAFRAWSALPE